MMLTVVGNPVLQDNPPISQHFNNEMNGVHNRLLSLFSWQKSGLEELPCIGDYTLDEMVEDTLELYYMQLIHCTQSNNARSLNNNNKKDNIYN